MRKGEILGLMWSDVDWKKGTLRIERQLQQASFERSGPGTDQDQIQPASDQARQRACWPCWKRIVRNRKPKKLLAGDRWKEHGMIFTTSIGTYIDQTKVSREFKSHPSRAPGCRISASTTCGTPRSRSCWT